MAELEQIMRALRNADAAGDTVAAQRLADMARAAQASAQPVIQVASAQPQNVQTNGATVSFAPTSGASGDFGGPAPRSLAYEIGDNVIGFEDGVETPGEKLGTLGHMAIESLTLGAVGDEANARADAMLGRGAYEDRRDFYRQNQANMREESPAASFAADVAPAFIPGAGMAGLAAKGTSLVGRAATGATMGAAAGGAYGYMEGEGDNRLENARNTAMVGGLFGAAAPRIAETLTGIPNGLKRLFTRAEQRPTVQALQAVKNAAYRAVDEAGEVFSGDEMQGLAQRVRTVFEDGNYVEDVDNASRAALAILDRRTGPTTLPQLDRVRQNLWKRYATAQDQPQILDAIGAIDELIETHAGSSELMAAARAANARFAKSQLLEDAYDRAERQTARTGSGGNIGNNYRAAVDRILNSDRQRRFFSADEIELMRDFVKGTRGQDVARLVGKLSPSGNGLMMALHTIGGVVSQGASIPLMAVGAGAKRMADRSVEQGAEVVRDVMAGGAVPSRAARQITAPQASAIVGATPAADQLQSYRQNR